MARTEFAPAKRRRLRRKKDVFAPTTRTYPGGVVIEALGCERVAAAAATARVARRPPPPATPAADRKLPAGRPTSPLGEAMRAAFTGGQEPSAGASIDSIGRMTTEKLGINKIWAASAAEQ